MTAARRVPPPTALPLENTQDRGTVAHVFDNDVVTRDLTARQEQVLHCITDHVNEHGYPPTIRQIAETVGYVSTSSVAHVLGRLEKFGYLKRGIGGHAYPVTDDGK